MEKALNEQAPCRYELQVEWTNDEVREEFNKSLNSYCKQAKIPGFRPGRAPREIVAKRYKKELSAEIEEKLIHSGFRAVAEEDKVSILNVVELDNEELNANEGFSFKAVFDVAPSIELPEYKGIKLVSQPVEITDEQVDEACGQVLDRFASFNDVEDRAIAEGDMVKLSYTGECADLDEDLPEEAAKLLSNEDGWMATNDDSFIPGFGQQLVGASFGEEIAVTIEFPEDYFVPQLVGKTVNYKAVPESAREKIMPEMTDEFLSGLGVESEDDLRSKIREDLQNRGEQEEKNRQREEMINTLLEAIECGLPESSVQSETQSCVYDLVRRNSEAGVPEEMISERKDELMAAAEEMATKQVKLRFIASEIAKSEKIKVSNMEIEQRIAMIAQGSQMTPKKVKQRIKENGTEGRLIDELMVSKVLDFVYDAANVV